MNRMFTIVGVMMWENPYYERTQAENKPLQLDMLGIPSHLALTSKFILITNWEMWIAEIAWKRGYL